MRLRKPCRLADRVVFPNPATPNAGDGKVTISFHPVTDSCPSGGVGGPAAGPAVPVAAAPKFTG